MEFFKKDSSLKTGMTIEKSDMNNLFRSKVLLELLLVMLIFIIHAYLRLGNLGNSAFEYDQNMIAEKAYDIAKNFHPVFIGTRVGDYPLYVPPYFLYIAAIFSLIFRFHPYAQFYHAYFWSLSTLFLLYITTRRLFSLSTALNLSLVYTVSPLIVSYERIPWNPNPLQFMSFATIIILYYILSSRRIDLFLFALLSTAIGFALSSHFSGLLLLLTSIIVITIDRKWTSKSLLVFFSIQFLVILPLILFDIKNGFLNLKGFINLITTNAGNTQQAHLFIRFLNNFSVYNYYFSELTLLNKNSLLTLCFFFLSFWLVVKRRIKLFLPLILILVTPLIAFTVYQGSVPEYYFLIVIPAFIILIGMIFYYLQNYKFVTLIIILYGILLFRQSYSQMIKDGSNSLNNKLAVLYFLKSKADDQNIKLEYDMDPSWQLGYPYLLQYAGIKTDKNSKNQFWIVYPLSSKLSNWEHIIYQKGDFGVAQPNRQYQKN